MAYQFKASDVYDFARSIGADVREKGDELNFKKCPYCGESEGQFSVNLESGAFKCFRETCKKQGHFVQLARDFNFTLDFGEMKQSYRPLPQPKRKIETSGDAAFYLGEREIDWKVAERYGVTTSAKNPDILCFPFFDESGVLQTVKYRNMAFVKGVTKGGKEWTEKDTKPILFGMNLCEGFDRVIITEGQLDALAVATCGIGNVVSVPMGATNFAWYSNCSAWLRQFKSVIVFGDWEYKKGDRMTLLDELRKRLPHTVVIKAVPKANYLGEKDANDILRKYGRAAVVEAVEAAKVPPVAQIKRGSEVRDVDLSALPKVKTYIRELDRILDGGIRFGELTVITGKRGKGKSTVMSSFAAAAIDQGIATFIYSGELQDFYCKRWLDLQLAGPNHVVARQNEYGDMSYSIPADVQKKINEWYHDKFFMFDNGFVPHKDEELLGLIEVIEQAITYYNCRFICVDNLMTAMNVDLNSDLFRAQSQFVKKLAWIAKAYDVAVVLVAHPKKSKAENGAKFDNDNVAGSADVTNAADTVIHYEKNESDTYQCDGLMEVVKNRITGKETKAGEPIELLYAASCKRVTSFLRPEKPRVYGWENDAVAAVDDLAWALVEDDSFLPEGW